jgi:hypothetical protein
MRFGSPPRDTTTVIRGFLLVQTAVAGILSPFTCAVSRIHPSRCRTHGATFHRTPSGPSEEGCCSVLFQFPPWSWLAAVVLAQTRPVQGTREPRQQEGGSPAPGFALEPLRALSVRAFASSRRSPLELIVALSFAERSVLERRVRWHSRNRRSDVRRFELPSGTLAPRDEHRSEHGFRECQKRSILWTVNQREKFRRRRFTARLSAGATRPDHQRIVSIPF